MLRITTADYELLIKVRNILKDCGGEMPCDYTDTIDAFITYVDDLESRKEEDLAKHREALKKWRESPTGKEKIRIINNRGVRNYRARKKSRDAELNRRDKRAGYVNL